MLAYTTNLIIPKAVSVRPKWMVLVSYFAGIVIIYPASYKQCTDKFSSVWMEESSAEGSRKTLCGTAWREKFAKSFWDKTSS